MIGELPRLWAISDRLSLPGQDLATWLAGLAAAGVDGVQLREKDLDDRALYELTRAARERLPAATRLVVNGRVDVALAAGADGAHLPWDAPPMAALRRRFGPDLLLGQSVHTPEEVAAARDDGADYVVFGPVFPTPGKAEHGTLPGLPGLAAACEHGLPVYALGGVEPERFAAVAAAGARGAAGIRMVQQAAGLPALVALAQRTFTRPGARTRGTA